MKKTMGIVAVLALALVAGCAGMEGAEQPRTTALDGHVFRVALASDRGGAPSMIEMKFANGSLEASDASIEGALELSRDGLPPARYTFRGEAI
jgi:hypothetical protein